jgi:hypothetical protein
MILDKFINYSKKVSGCQDVDNQEFPQKINPKLIKVNINAGFNQ